MENFDPNVLINAARLSVDCFAKKRFPGFFSEYELEETISKTICKVLLADTYDPAKGDFRTWVRGAAERAVLTAAKKKATYKGLFVSFDDLSPASDEDSYEYPDDMAELGYGSEMPDEVLIAKETCENIQASLGERARRILDLRCEGYASGEIARKLGISTSAAYMAVHHMLDKVKKVA